MASRSRASTSAGPAVASTTSSTSQSAVTAVRPPSVVTRISGTVTPVVRISRQSERDAGQVAASVDQQRVSRAGVEQCGALGGQHPHLVGEQLERRQHRLGGGAAVRQEQQPCHASSSSEPVESIDRFRHRVNGDVRQRSLRRGATGPSSDAEWCGGRATSSAPGRRTRRRPRASSAPCGRRRDRGRARTAPSRRVARR